MRASTIGNNGFVIPLAGVEGLKWFGLVCMLQEHVFRWGFHTFPFPVWLVGRMAFPFFAIALAVSVPRDGDALLKVLKRLIMWGCVAEALRIPVLPEGFAHNVMFTLALGLIVAQSFQMRWTGFVVSLVCLALGAFVEFGMFGVLFVAFTRVYFATLNRWLLVAAAAVLCLANSSVVPVLAFFVAPIVAANVVRLPRVKGFFYWVYCAHWPIIWGLRYVA